MAKGLGAAPSVVLVLGHFVKGMRPLFWELCRGLGSGSGSGMGGSVLGNLVELWDKIIIGE